MENYKSFSNTLILTFTLLITNWSLYAQDSGKITGKVVDLVNSSPVMYVNISLHQATNFIRKTVTDQKGEFVFESLNVGVYEIKASMMGYKEKIIKNIQVKKGQERKITLSLKILKEQLSEVIIVDDQEVLQKSIFKGENDSPKMIRDITSGSSAKRIKHNNSVNVLIADEYNTEQYDYQPENEFRNALRVPLSTFSIDVDVASYANTRRFLNSGHIPPIDAVRIEELINYFTYNYKEPNGEHPIAIHTEMAECPWNKKHNILKVGLQAKKIAIKNLPPSNLTFLLDVSGSMMSANKLPLLKSALGLLVNQLRPEDKVAIVVYAGAAGLVLPPTHGNDKQKILNAINQLRAGGSTAGGAGIKLAYQVAKEGFEPNGNNRVILATDGDFNIGVSSDGELVRMIEAKRETGIYLTVLGFGTGNLKDSKMEKLADKGNGNYAYIDNIMEAKKVLVSEMGGTLFTVAKDVKIQIEFNPARVKSYKLIGYENRMLKDKDFNDDKKDAGEIGSGHTVTALYEIVPASEDGSAPAIDPLKYQDSNLKAAGNELLTLKVRYKYPLSSSSSLLKVEVLDKKRKFENASNDFKFASSVAMFGMLLKHSEFKGEASYSLSASIARSAKGNDNEGYRSEFIRLVELAQELDKAVVTEKTN